MTDDGTSLSASHSQLLSSSPSSSLSPSRLCSKAYKKSSQLYLTRRLQEALSNLEPVISTPTTDTDSEQYANGDGVGHATAPIAAVSSTWRIKVWNLYITLLSAIIDLGPEEGKKTTGQKEWKDIATKVREGEIWQTIVQTGYNGIEGSVDAEVVYNLATLLLNHSPSQVLNQQRLETFLSSYGQPNLDTADSIQTLQSDTEQNHTGPGNGANTPKDLATRVTIIELFTLHVLPRNDEWEYAKEFINMSEVLDEEQKEIFLQTLESLEEEKDMGDLRAAEIQRGKEAEMEKQKQEAERQMAEEIASAERSEKNGHKRTNNGADFGIEKNRPNGTSKGKGAKSGGKQTGTKGSSASGRSALSASSSSSKDVKKPEKPAARAGQIRALANALRNLLRHITQSVSSNPLSVFRTLVFMLGIVMALSRQKVRERLGRITGAGWQKVKGTIGMGVKVSYI